MIYERVWYKEIIMEELNSLNPIESTKKESTPWWLLFNILALDAPIVALVWQHFFSKTFDVEISFTEKAVLFFTVWFIYLLDHFLDSRKGIHTTQRHLFAGRNPKTTLALISFTFAASIWLSFTLSKQLIIGGMILAIVICIYLILVHSNLTDLIIKKNCKELLVGIGFGTGVALPVIISDLSITTWLPSVTLFCLICWANCKLIENWESNYMRFSKTDIILIMFLFCCMFFSKNYFVVASIISMTSFLMLNNFIGSKNIQLSRVLADVSLLSPLVFANYT